jgi:hypothetical protein
VYGFAKALDRGHGRCLLQHRKLNGWRPLSRCSAQKQHTRHTLLNRSVLPTGLAGLAESGINLHLEDALLGCAPCFSRSFWLWAVASHLNLGKTLTKRSGRVALAGLR